jgi:hypothetical protein
MELSCGLLYMDGEKTEKNPNRKHPAGLTPYPKQ